MARLKDLYKSRIVPELTGEFNYKNPMAVPRMEKVIISMGWLFNTDAASLGISA
ncbi:unnamed protein product [marine sediment metagenome]|uniref:50S ribosomal protein L5 n=1 Tax=marine sediment metagenome TaxID=412755 RepID=X1SS93_9ZZZZ